ncbi:hypothetical protein Aau02nite_79120 [Amorphoplanes auranticolor]|uniref:Uncharacterized protein n=1 Tax=Actinoplanes auranticolor TaxID=47988 RepID=A0A919SS89_9ACTN|nr:hypothetical protein Aau02nite_79120 [Actinoplanes auranticolor]
MGGVKVGSADTVTSLRGGAEAGSLPAAAHPESTVRAAASARIPDLVTLTWTYVDPARFRRERDGARGADSPGAAGAGWIS